ncbi:MAG: sulfatase [Saprospiraceae bacterium]
MSKKLRFHLLILSIGSLGLGACQNQPTKNKRLPNILIISADDLNYNSVGVFGCEVQDITPNIDQLASEGIRFTNAHVNTPVCQPSRQSWLTGKFPHANGAEGFEPINENIPTLTEQLKQLGYINGILGKEIHHQPKERFFWDYIPFVTEPDSIWRKGSSRDPSLFYTYSKKFFDLASARDQPFFLSANAHDPHRPFIGSRQDTMQWGIDNMPPVSRQYTPAEVDVLGYLPDIKDIRKEVAQYYGNVYRCDQSIGAVLDALKESGAEENTLVIFLSDHGAAFPFAKAQCYLNSSKTPLIIKWPGQIAPGTLDTSHFVTGIDLMPTILEIVGQNTLQGLEGNSFLPLLSNQVQEDRDYAYSSFYQIFARIRYPMRCVQNKQYGYIYNFWSDQQQEIRGDATGGLTWKAMLKAAEIDPEIAKRVELYRHRVPEEFYDFKNDPDALHNLVDNPAYRQELDQFRAKMLDMMIQYKDPAYEAYRDRNEVGRIEQFMEAERERAKRTKPVVRF